MASTSNISDANEKIKRKKGLKQVIYKSEIIKKAKLKGSSYINYSGRRISAVRPGVCSCKQHCANLVEVETRDDLFDQFRNLTTKNEQDIYLQNLIETKPVARRREREQSTRKKPKTYSCVYSINTTTGRVNVCKKMFMKIFGVTPERIRRINKLLIEGKTPVDGRGQGPPRNMKTAVTRNKVLEHIQSFPTKTAHYTGKEYQFLHEKLSIKIMHKLYKSKNPGFPVSYWYYRKIFKQEFSLSFGRPQVDACQTCEELKIKIRAKSLSENARKAKEAELMVHKRRASKFYKKMAMLKETINDKILVISIDYMQNIHLPRIPVQEVFYLRQLNFNIFCIHDIRKEKATFYMYHEGIAAKGPNEVCSFINDYIQEHKNGFEELHIFADSCTGQNRNNTLIRMLLFYTDTQIFRKVVLHFPVRGHSFMPCDRDFGTVKRQLKLCDRIYTPKEYAEEIMLSTQTDKFTIVMVPSEMVLNFKEWWATFYKKNSISLETAGRQCKQPDKIHFQVLKFYQFEFCSNIPGCVLARDYIDGLKVHTFRLKTYNSSNLPILPTQKAFPDGKKAINVKKLNDVKKLEEYLPEEHQIQTFYREIFDWPTTTTADAPEEL